MARQERTKMYRISENLVKTATAVLSKLTACGAELLPDAGGYVVCVNHISYLDPMVVANFLLRQRAFPYFLAKESLFRVPITGQMLRMSEQIPVHRRSSRAKEAYSAATSALKQEKVVVIFPEGTITGDDDLWPMAAKLGAARLALTTGVPVVPIATWGGQTHWPAYGRGPTKMLPRCDVAVRVGTPLRLGGPTESADPEAVQAATDRIMAAITAELAVLRAETPPTKGQSPCNPLY